MVWNTAGLLGPHCFLRQVTIQVTNQHVGTCGDSAVTKHLTSHVLRRLDLDQLHANSTNLVRPAYPHRARAPLYPAHLSQLARKLIPGHETSPSLSMGCCA